MRRPAVAAAAAIAATGEGAGRRCRGRHRRGAATSAAAALLVPHGSVLLLACSLFLFCQSAKADLYKKGDVDGLTRLDSKTNRHEAFGTSGTCRISHQMTILSRVQFERSERPACLNYLVHYLVHSSIQRATTLANVLITVVVTNGLLRPCHWRLLGLPIVTRLSSRQASS